MAGTSGALGFLSQPSLCWKICMNGISERIARYVRMCFGEVGA